MFTEISMTNFKSWRETGPVRMAPLTAFFGGNSSGKSSLLQMLLLMKQTAESNDRNLVLKTGSKQPGYVNLGTPQEITFGDETELGIGFSWRRKDKPLLTLPTDNATDAIALRDMSFAAKIHAEAKSIHVQSLKYQSCDHFRAQLKRQASNRYAMQVKIRGEEPPHAQDRPPLPKPEKCYGFPAEARAFYANGGFLQDLQFALECQLRELRYLGPLRVQAQRRYVWSGHRPSDVGQRGEEFVSAYLAAQGNKVYPAQRKSKRNRMDSRIAQWLVELDLAQSFCIAPVAAGSNIYEVSLRRERDGSEVLLPDMGIGVSQVLPVLVLCYYAPPGSTVILEQPELHLHPSVQAGLADVFIDVVQNRDVQIIVESHSEHFLRRLQRRIAEEALDPCDTALHYCESCGGESKLTPLEVNMYGAICNGPKSFFGDLSMDIVAAFDAEIARKAR